MVTRSAVVRRRATANGANGRPGQYDLSQIIGYTGSEIGVGRKLKTHGLNSVDTDAVLGPKDDSNYKYPYDAFPYFRDPSLSGAQSTAS